MDHSGPSCDAALSSAFTILGKRWNGVILGVLADGGAGFADLSRGLGSQISDSMLSGRLTELAEMGLIERAVAPGPPVSVRYSLTPGGRALIPALDALASWARLHLAPPKADEAAG
jgi:DNA-binding HxlR family transcriptional regulator